MLVGALTVGQRLKGISRTYTLTKQLHECVWLASAQYKEPVIVKSVRHFRLQNERDILYRFQNRGPYLRPLVDEIEGPDAPPALVLKYLDDDLLHASNIKTLSSREVKYVARGILEGLNVLHQEGYIHTDKKPSNVLINYRQHDIRFSDVQLADFGSTVHMDSSYAISGDPIGTPIFRSPEAQLQMRWDTATDIWSLGATLVSMIYGKGFHPFKPDVPPEDDEYDLKILMKHHRCFGPFPVSYEEIADQDRIAALTWVMRNSPRETLRPFAHTTEREISRDDKQFILRIMKLDPRDRPTAGDLLEDSWFSEP